MHAEFAPDVEALAHQRNTDVAATLADLKTMYDGYHFTFAANALDIYNPFSLLHAFNSGELDPYWVTSGGSSLLFDLLNGHWQELPDYSATSVVDAQSLRTSDFTFDDPALFLYQMGYLTIKSSGPGIAELGYPNGEIRQAMARLALASQIKDGFNGAGNYITAFQKAVARLDLDTAMAQLAAYVAATPYSSLPMSVEKTAEDLAPARRSSTPWTKPTHADMPMRGPHPPSRSSS